MGMSNATPAPPPLHPTRVRERDEQADMIPMESICLPCPQLLRFLSPTETRGQRQQLWWVHGEDAGGIWLGNQALLTGGN